MMIKIFKYHLPAGAQILKTILPFANSARRVKNILPIAVIFFLSLVWSNRIFAQVLPADYAAGTLTNFVRTWDAKAPEQNPNTFMTRPLKDVKQATQYFDGLGRPLQTVIKEGSLETLTQTKKDMVRAMVYDEFGREQYKFLPFVASITGTNTSVNDGAFKLNPFQQQKAFYSDLTNPDNPIKSQGETFFYSKTNFEASPLNRPTDSYAPGNSWVGSEANPDPAQRKNVQMKYYINTAIDAVRIWNVTNNASMGNFGSYTSTLTYAAGELYKNITIDEHKKQVIEFKDKEGKVILKKVQISTAAGTEDDGTGRDHPGWLCTYYIYDDLNNLRAVIQPEAVKKMSDPPTPDWSLTSYLDEQCFRYEYDQRNRMIKKKVPGAAAVAMVYDIRDRLVLMQDGNLNAQGKWIYTLYDDNLNRPLATGLWPSTLTWAQHTPLANDPLILYPSSALSGHEELTRSFYDDYTWLAANGNPFANTRSTLDDASFNLPITSYPYYQALTQSNALKGMVTGSKTKVLGTASTYLFSISFYDDKGRVIQNQVQNITTGTDISTTQYNWAGQPMISVLRQQKGGATNPQTHIVITKMLYDDLGRLLNVNKTLNSTINGVAFSKPEIEIVNNKYNSLGQLTTKNIGKKKDPVTFAYTTAAVESLVYDYNIRGWLLGMNRSYLGTAGQSSTTTKFGFELGYDKLTGNSSGRNFTTAQYNGNICGMAWKSDGDDVKRKYDFSYDAANRLLKGQFEQDDATSSWNKTTMDYSIQMGNGSDPTTAYDANGNIQAMTQFGFKLGVSATIPLDNLRYNYIAGSNKLKSVTDFNNDAASKLGDFKTNTAHPQATLKTGLTTLSTQAQFDAITDYSYDVNGNLNTDLNKGIGSSIPPLGGGGAITYNHLNLPTVIIVPGKGTITYTYDAAGNKLQKQSLEPNATVVYNSISYATQIITTTTYIAGLVYETKTYSNATIPAAAIQTYTDQLQFIPHEEGRIRFKPAVLSSTGTVITAASFEYDYLLKDHLGNVRMVLTDEIQPGTYPTLSFEGVSNSTEVNNQRDVWEDASGNPFDVTGKRIASPLPLVNATALVPATLTNSVLVRSSTGKVGAGKLIKVMAGDKINTTVQYYFSQNANTGSASSLSTLVNMLSPVLNNSVAASGSVKGNGASISAAVNTDANAISFFSPQNSTTNNGRPKAFLNVLFFDEQFKFDNTSSYSEQISTTNPGQIVIALGSVKQAKKNGYCYVYISNENDDMVYFDNFTLKHERSSLIEETHYYPFGLTMAGISSRSAGTVENKTKFQGQEFAHGEFGDGSGLDMYEFRYRMDDCQTGRFWQIDPLAEDYFFNSAYAFSENKVTSHIELEGLESVNFNLSFGMSQNRRLGDNLLPSNQLATVSNRSIGNGIRNGATNFAVGLATPPIVPIVNSILSAWNGNFKPAFNFLVPSTMLLDKGLQWYNGDSQDRAQVGTEMGLTVVATILGGRASGSSRVAGSSSMTEFSLLPAAGTEVQFTANGSFYSVAFETQISKSLYPGGSYWNHFKAANTALSNAMATDAKFAASMENLGVTVPTSSRGIQGISPANWVWHHASEPGFLQLVPKVQHPNNFSSIFWETLHPNGVGGNSLWNK